MSESPRCWRKRQYFERTFILEASPCWGRDFQWRGFCALSFKVDSSSWLSFSWGSTNRSEWVSVAQKRRWGQRGSKQQLLLRPDLDVGQGWKIFGFASKSFRAGKKTYKTGLQMNSFWKFLSKTDFGRKRNRIYIFFVFQWAMEGGKYIFIELLIFTFSNFFISSNTRWENSNSFWGKQLNACYVGLLITWQRGYFPLSCAGNCESQVACCFGLHSHLTNAFWIGI